MRMMLINYPKVGTLYSVPWAPPRNYFLYLLFFVVVPQVTDFHRRFLRMEGFNVSRWRHTKWTDGISKLNQLITDGKLKTFETIVESFESLPQTYKNVVDKKDFGVTLIKL